MYSNYYIACTIFTSDTLSGVVKMLYNIFVSIMYLSDLRSGGLKRETRLAAVRNVKQS